MSVSYEQFRYALGNPARRAALGLPLTNNEAEALYSDPSASVRFYKTWSRGTGQLPTPAVAPQAAMPQPREVVYRPMKQAGIAYLFLIFLGGFGAHLFYLNRIKQAFMLLVLAQIGVWGSAYQTLSAAPQNPLLSIVIVFAAGMVIVDLFCIPTYVREANATSR
ncbi:TM2 domain-containing protein [Plantibacter cousiniae (nom. nud.)]|uniref:TM2 domain-containing protein n=1 Tax=Plantibacter cousiniae (nom. nud.) TaxID=199709 RepID=A0ABY1LH74_9MICO|nr:TM2 domain-containing protein [Plantibacter cousiniae]SKC40361.1 TM2 domain-containing protein [Plantibacter cousiniae]